MALVLKAKVASVDQAMRDSSVRNLCVRMSVRMGEGALGPIDVLVFMGILEDIVRLITGLGLVIGKTFILVLNSFYSQPRISYC